MERLGAISLAICLFVSLPGCGGSPGESDDQDEPSRSEICAIREEDPEFAESLGCTKDFEALASLPLSTAIPGARSVKTVIDQLDDNALYFQNSTKYPIHYDFASTHLSGKGHPVVPPLSQFNTTEYGSPDRRFILGALTHYEGPGLWAYEIAPYDTAGVEMIETAFELVKKHAFIGEELVFHATSDTVEKVAKRLNKSIPVATTDDIFAGIDYQPLNLATAIGRLRFRSGADLEQNPISFRDIVVLDKVPNDISVCSGTITSTLQTPLSHINVLAQNRGTPNMGLKGASDSKQLRDLEGKWVELTVGAFNWKIEKVTEKEADAWWEEHRPAKVRVPKLDLKTTDIVRLEDLLDLSDQDLGEALKEKIPAYGGKATHFAAIPHIESIELRYPDAFVVPVHYYRQFMEENGLDLTVEELLEDQKFKADPLVRMDRLTALQDQIMQAPIPKGFLTELKSWMRDVFPAMRVKFRSSTNCEDLDGFTGAGLYVSQAAELDDPKATVEDAVRTVWASIWRYRAFEEREYRGIAHLDVAMALLVNRAFPDEDANGVAITANPFDTEGMEPGFYINVQKGDESVVLPDPGVSSDQFIVHYGMTGQPVSYLGHSSLVPEGETVLTRGQVNQLGEALTAINNFFEPVYGPNTPEHFYAMDVEFKFDSNDTGKSVLYVKQARPYPGRGH